jgi:hypothetical protein
MERQKHGFEYEKHIIGKYNLVASEGYTDKFDAYYTFNTGSIPVQIKCIKWGGEVDLADYRRCAETTTDFILIVGFYDDVYAIDNILREIIVYVDATRWRSLLQFDESAAMYAEMGKISNNRNDDPRWNQFMTHWHDKYTTCYQPDPKVSAICPTRIAKLRFKRDHKDQKRIQCAINFKNFLLYAEKLFTTWDFNTNDHSKPVLETRYWKFVDRVSADIIIASNICQLSNDNFAIDPIGTVFCIKVLGLDPQLFYQEMLLSDITASVCDIVMLESSLNTIADTIYVKMLLRRVSLNGAIDALTFKSANCAYNAEFNQRILTRLRKNESMFSNITSPLVV